MKKRDLVPYVFKPKKLYLKTFKDRFHRYNQPELFLTIIILSYIISIGDRGNLIGGIAGFVFIITIIAGAIGTYIGKKHDGEERVPRGFFDGMRPLFWKLLKVLTVLSIIGALFIIWVITII